MESPIRRLAIPHDHILAEVAALPLVTEEAFRNGLTVLHPLLSTDDPTGANEATKALWRAAERMLTGSFPSMSLDDLTNLRDWVWFGGNHADPVRPVPLREYASRVVQIWRGLADASIGGADASDLLARRRDRWFAFALPRGLLGGPEPPPMPSRLARMLDEERFSETHLHLGVGMEFAVLWASAARAMAVAPPKAPALKAPGAAFDDGTELTGWLVRAMTVRYLLAAYLAERGTEGPFLRWVARRLGWLDSGLLFRLRCVLDEVCTGEMSTGLFYDEAVDLYGQLVGTGGPRQYHEREAMIRADPVWTFFPGATGYPDQRLHETARRHLDARAWQGASERDPMIERLYWQLVRLQGSIYRHVVQRPMTPGLMWFIRTYAHASPMKKMLSKGFLIRAARRTSGERCGLRSLEVRTAPEDSVAENLKLVAAVAELSGLAGEHGSSCAGSTAVPTSRVFRPGSWPRCFAIYAPRATRRAPTWSRKGSRCRG